MDNCSGTELQITLPPRDARRTEDSIPSSPPPSYEHVLAETRSAALSAAASVDSGTGTPGDEAASLSRQSSTTTPTTTPTTAVAVKRQEILHKSSKELYKAVAAQWGITCKMSDHCRCLDCQSKYFDCEYDQNEDEKTDGGLGAGTPMFISEVMAGTACAIL